jgi:hypothetical protein
MELLVEPDRPPRDRAHSYARILSVVRTTFFFFFADDDRLTRLQHVPQLQNRPPDDRALRAKRAFRPVNTETPMFIEFGRAIFDFGRVNLEFGRVVLPLW